MTDNAVLTQGLKLIGFDMELIDLILEPLNLYIDELVLFNASFDLVGADNRSDIIVRHILDSLSAWTVIDQLIKSRINVTNSTDASENQANHSAQTSADFCLSDIGTGSGLPGIPLAIILRLVYPHVKVKLVERMSRRCAFLENCVALLGLKNVTVYNMELERLDQDFTDIAVFRAFRPLDKKITKNLLRIVKKGGYLAAYKAKKNKIEEEMEAIKNFIPEYTIQPLTLPFLQDTERNLVIVNC